MKKNSLVILLLIVGVLGYFGYKIYKTSPQYSVTQISKAMKDKDRYLFEKHVDVESLVSRAVDDFMAYSMSTMPNDDTSGFANVFAMGFIQMIKPTLITAAKQGVYRYIESGKFEMGGVSGNKEEKAEDTNNTKSTENKILELTQTIKPTGKFSIKQDKSTSVCSIEIKDSRFNKPFNLDFRLIKTPDNFWKVTEISNLKEYIEQYDKLDKAWKKEQNTPLLQQINKVCQIESASKSVSEKTFSKEIVYSVSIKNLSDKPIKAITGIITAQSNSFKDVLNAKADSGIKSNSNETFLWTKDANMFNKNEMGILEAPDAETKVSFQLCSIVFDSGEKIELPYQEVI